MMASISTPSFDNLVTTSMSPPTEALSSSSHSSYKKMYIDKITHLLILAFFIGTYTPSILYHIDYKMHFMLN